MTPKELSPAEQLRQELMEKESGAARRKEKKLKAKKEKAKRASVVAKKPKTKKAVKADKAKPKPKPKAKATTRTGDTPRVVLRDRKGDGLTPVERKIIEFISAQSKPVNVVTVAHSLFGEDCPSEGPNSFRTIRNGIRFPIRYGMLETVPEARGTYRIGKDFKSHSGDLNKLADRYRSRVGAEKKAS